MNTSTLQSEATTSILVRALEPDNIGPMPRAVAQYLVNLRPAERDCQRADELAARARFGELSESERIEIEDRRRVGKFFEALKLVAQRTLQAGHEA
jgi:hypothetical protein